MTDCLEIYKCEVCGNIVQVLHSAKGELVCCQKPMTLLKLQTNDVDKQEKHVPVFWKNGTVQIGSILHPMTDLHHIEFVEMVTFDNKDIKIHFFNPMDKPLTSTDEKKDYTYALEYCNLHGLWRGEKK